MTSRSLSRSLLPVSLLALFAAAQPASADSGHARVVRLSVVEGDVRFVREAHGDPLADPKANWEKAEANLPIRHGYVVATDNGRAAVEFENGAMAFLNENTVLDFYDLSLEEGGRITRLVLRQGSASFYINPGGGDYFSVTGGDFTAEADGKTSFRINNFDDGSNVDVLSGRINVLHKKDTTALIKGQSFSMKAGDEAADIGRLPTDDDFDRWVSSRTDAVSSATTAAAQYTSASYYAPGYADLYTYGSFFDCGGYGYGWRPFGVGFGWSPFSAGQWMWDPSFGWTFMSSQPWGWAPYHYGGWLFDASCGGWFYSPPLYYYGVPGNTRGRPIIHPPHPLLYRASTAVFVRQNGQVGIVPFNQLDKDGKPPLNSQHGVFSFETAVGATEPALLASGASSEKWEAAKSPSHEALAGASQFVATTAPPRLSRSMSYGNSPARVLALSSDSSIVYDPTEHRFVTTNSASSSLRAQESAEKSSPEAKPGEPAAVPARTSSVTVARATTPPRSVPAPPPARTAATGGFRGGESEFGGGASHASSTSSASHASAPAASSGGGRPH
jgi:hypothetical protein